jgi:hypothetical protein
VYEWRPGNFQTPVLRAQMGEFAGAVGAGLFALEGIRRHDARAHQ